MKSKYYLSLSAIIITVLATFLGQGVLSFFNYPQSDPSSSAIFRIHPLTYFLIFLSVINTVKYKGRISEIIYKKYKSYFLVTIIIFLYSIISNQSKSNVFFLDTLINPILIIYNLQFIKHKGFLTIRKVLVFFFVSNAFLAIIERILSYQFFPVYETEGVVFAFRSTAFLGHPLNNTLINTFLCLFFFISAKSNANKAIYALLGITASICFGGRAGFAVLLIFIILLSFQQNGKSKMQLVLPVLLILLTLGSTYFLIFYTDFGNRLLLYSSLSDSSFGARVEVFKIFKHLNLRDLILGLSQRKIDHVMYLEHILIIENFWLIWILKYGFVFTLLLAISFIKFLSNISSGFSFFQKNMLIFSFILTASGNNSLATSTMAICIFVLACSVKQWEVHSQNVQSKAISLNKIASQSENVNLKWGL